ncbi:hypothetical protein B9Z19DRAFT_1142941 [Tuber borchii]|uniref:LIM zinc-binding domain-containing protein n=1 Tax=Tuber borchii TaxID=42251 RepID=A0A2T6ZS76_TUBBO|nr:hypothetical protein B9Z19DRAFT_1142941 [Tuber borchii]
MPLIAVFRFLRDNRPDAYQAMKESLGPQLWEVVVNFWDMGFTSFGGPLLPPRLGQSNPISCKLIVPLTPEFAHKVLTCCYEEEIFKMGPPRELEALPRVGSGQTTGAAMRNNQKYGARVLPPPPPAVEIVISDNPPSTASSSGSTITKAPFIPTIRAPEDNSRPPVPTISLPDGDEGKKGTKSAPPVPSISLPGEPSSSASAEPPVPTPPASWRPLPTPRAFPKPPSSNYSSSSSTGCGPTVSCTYCRIPIWSRLPFNPSSKFVLKDGCAWCVGYYQERYSGRCKKCRQPITETAVTLLGAAWHEACSVALNVPPNSTMVASSSVTINEKKYPPAPVGLRVEAEVWNPPSEYCDGECGLNGISARAYSSVPPLESHLSLSISGWGQRIAQAISKAPRESTADFQAPMPDKGIKPIPKPEGDSGENDALTDRYRAMDLPSPLRTIDENATPEHW